MSSSFATTHQPSQTPFQHPPLHHSNPHKPELPTSKQSSMCVVDYCQDCDSALDPIFYCAYAPGLYSGRPHLCDRPGRITTRMHPELEEDNLLCDGCERARAREEYAAREYERRQASGYRSGSPYCANTLDTSWSRAEDHYGNHYNIPHSNYYQNLRSASEYISQSRDSDARHRSSTRDGSGNHGRDTDQTYNSSSRPSHGNHSARHSGGYGSYPSGHGQSSSHRRR